MSASNPAQDKCPNRCRQRAGAALAKAAVAAACMAAPMGAAASPLPTQTIIDAGERVQAYIVPSLAARIAAMPKNLPRAPGPALDVSIDAARAAVQACAAKNVKVSVLIADSTGMPVVMLSGDGAGVRSQLIAQTKVNIVIRFGKASGEVAEEAKSDPRLTAQAVADPGIGVLRGGGLPILRDGQLIGAVAVSGAGLSGDLTLDEACARVALDHLRG